MFVNRIEYTYLSSKAIIEKFPNDGIIQTDKESVKSMYK